MLWARVVNRLGCDCLSWIEAAQACLPCRYTSEIFQVSALACHQHHLGSFWSFTSFEKEM